MKQLILIFLFIPQHAFAIEYTWTEACDKTQRTMTNCSIEQFRFYDEQLNELYKDAMNSLSNEKQEQLRSEQRRWLNNRDPSCQNNSDDIAKGGSMWPMIYNGCRADATSKRILEINKWLQH